MKQSFLLLLTLGLLAIGLAGCSDAVSPSSESEQSATVGGAPAPADALTQKDLLRHRFVLVSVNGSDFSGKEQRPELSFTEEFRAFGGICNRFTGQGELVDGVLFVRGMALTRMLCADQDLNELEGLFAAMMEKGAAARLEGSRLILEEGSTILEYELSDPPAQ